MWQSIVFLAGLVAILGWALEEEYKFFRERNK